MLTIELINTNIPRLQLKDSVSKALTLVNDFRLTHLPVVENEKYLGLISEDDLLDAEEPRMPIELMQENFIKASVHENEHFLNAVTFCNQFDSTVVPVVNEEKELMGVITTSDLLKTLGNFAGTNEIGGIIVLEMERSQFAISEISRIVESNDATILHLNTTVHAETGLLTVTIHINKKEIAAIVATFERYEYDVIYYFGNENFENEIHSNYRHLMNYLDI
ncbi:MAG TPA: CBS domain-containing protein [Ferruginibacter sp.]|jgi:CBS domain-containing protein|nr:CBS domain-containing protein [Ferruginibacter sp.]MBN8699299.1 CBS domain-containing protein [Chitinophagales bacterium]HMX79005.1 CBS domain-containing protein [Ferruginibacter sp.]HNA01402.1 CBS domain-containing protein [Ferruginibacter sp.]HNA15136.1 CBS domain-containing protein [Ferruginibacter sp.]